MDSWPTAIVGTIGILATAATAWAGRKQTEQLASAERLERRRQLLYIDIYRLASRLLEAGLVDAPSWDEMYDLLPQAKIVGSKAVADLLEKSVWLYFDIRENYGDQTVLDQRLGELGKIVPQMQAIMR